LENVKVIPFSNQDVKVTGQEAVLKVDAETLFMKHFSGQDIATSVKVGRLMNLEPVTQEVTQKAIVMIPVK
jgi:hypothetical protein